MRRLLSTLLLGAAFSTAALAATNPHVTAHPQARITAKVDNKSVTQLVGTVPGKLAIATDLGRAGGSSQLTGLHLVLKPTDDQIAAMNHLMDEQQDKSSPNFHQWMTPDTFAASFGIEQSDIAKVTDWLASQGLTVNSVDLGGRIITFSGNVKSLEAAFHTEMHSVQLEGETHISNTTEVSIPAALSDVVIGPARLNDFTIKRQGIFKRLVIDKDGNVHNVVPGTKNTPDYTGVVSGNHFLAPADFNTIYNTTGLLAAGTNGSGIKIGIVGQTLIDVADTQIFRSIFGLPNNDPTIIQVGGTNGVVTDDIESDLDIQWSGAIAPQAKVIFAPAAVGYESGGIDSSALYFIGQNNVDIISMSYGGCEVSNTSTYTAYWNTMWAQAAAQGQSVFVSAGDSSATGCVSSGTTVATGATYGVNALGSSAYNVAVGGTMFNEGGYVGGLQKGVTSYWGAGGAKPYGTALKYIPESVMSDGAFNQVLGGVEAEAEGSPGVFGGGGGVSIFTARPPWQTGVGISATADPAGPTFTASGALKTGLHRLVPDVSLMGSLSHDDAIICYEGSCTTDPTTGLITGIGAVGGTSVAAPAWAGVMALIDQGNGGRQGNPNYYFYKLAAAETTLANCASVAQPATAVNTTCNFNDIVTGDNYSPLTANGQYIAPVLDSTGTTIVTPGYIQGTLGKDFVGFPATTGFDEATGLGSPNVANLVKNWKSVTFTSSTTTLAATPTTANHGTAIGLTVGVTATSGTPTGTVSIITQNTNGTPVNGNAPTVLTLATGTATANVTNLPGGTYTIVAQYSGDGTYSASTSAPVTVTIAKENSTIVANLTSISATTGGLGTVRNGAYTYGQMVYLYDQVHGASGAGVNAGNQPLTGVPTGTLTFTPTYTPTGGTATALAPLTVNLDSSAVGYLATAPWPYYDIEQNYPALAVGAYSVAQAYSGDNSFNPGTVTSTITVAKATSTPALYVITPDVGAGGTAQVLVQVAPIEDGVDSAGYYIQTGAFPSGTVNVFTTAAPTVTIGTAQMNQGFATISIPAASLVTGVNTVRATYVGDGNYNGASSSTAGGKITLLAAAPSTVTLSISPTAPAVLDQIVLTATIPAGALGTEFVTFYDNGTFLDEEVATKNGTTVSSVAIDWLTAGPHAFTASYGGNATTPAGASAALPVTIAKNSPGLTLNATSTNLQGTQALLQADFIPNPYFVEPNGAPVVPTQPITFFDKGVYVGTAALVFNFNSDQYTATLAITPAAGSHSYTAAYAGDANYNPIGQTLPIGVASAAPSVTYAFTPSSLVLPQGQAGVTQLTITGTAGWAGSVSIACSTPQPYTYCNLGATSASFTGQIAFYEPKNIAVSVVTEGPTPPVLGSFMWIPALFFAGFLAIRRKQLSLRGRQLLTLAILICGTTALSGCGKDVSRTGIQNGTPLGTYNVTITATATGSTSASPSGVQTITLPVTVTR